MSMGEVATAGEITSDISVSMNDEIPTETAKKRKGNLRNGVSISTPTYICACGGIARPFRAKWETKDEILYKCRKCFALYFDVGQLTQNRVRTARADKNSAVRRTTMDILSSIHENNPDELSTAGSIHRKVVETGLRVSKIMVDGILDDLLESGQVIKFAFLGRTGYRLK